LPLRHGNQSGEADYETEVSILHIPSRVR
jgi:hypothetical protein